METVNPICHPQSSVSLEAGTLFVSLELSRARWLVTSLAPGSSKISRHSVVGGDAKDLIRTPGRSPHEGRATHGRHR